MRNGSAANFCCQFFSLILSLLDSQINFVLVLYLGRVRIVKNQGCTREISLAQDRPACCSNQVCKLSLVCRVEIATEVESQP